MHVLYVTYIHGEKMESHLTHVHMWPAFKIFHLSLKA